MNFPFSEEIANLLQQHQTSVFISLAVAAVVGGYIFWSMVGEAVKRKLGAHKLLKKVEVAEGVIRHETKDLGMFKQLATYEAITELVTKAELNYYKHLISVASKRGYRIFSKVRLGDLIQVRKGLDDKTKLILNNKIQRKHIDFVVCDPKSLKVLAAIELNDRSHNRADRIKRDEEVRTALLMANIPLYEVECHRSYSEDSTRDMFKDLERLMTYKPTPEQSLAEEPTVVLAKDLDSRTKENAVSLMSANAMASEEVLNASNRKPADENAGDFHKNEKTVQTEQPASSSQDDQKEPMIPIMSTTTNAFPPNPQKDGVDETQAKQFSETTEPHREIVKPVLPSLKIQ